MSSIPQTSAAASGDLRPLVLKPQEERRLQAGHLWIFSNEVNVAATPLTAFTPGEHVQVRSSHDRFLGYAYVNPRTLISARLLGRDPDYPPGKSLLVHRFKVALAMRERLYRDAVLPARLRRGRPAAGPGRRSLRQRAGRADRHGRHGGDEGRHARGAWSRSSIRKPCSGRTTRPSGNWKGSSATPRPHSAPCPTSSRCRRAACCSACRSPPARRPAGISTRPPIGRLFARHAEGQRVLDVFSYVGEFRPAGGEGRRSRSHLRRFVGAGARSGGSDRRGQRRRSGTAEGRCLRHAGGAARGPAPLRPGRRRPAGLHQAQEGPSRGDWPPIAG